MLFFELSNPDSVDSPALIVDADRVALNIDRMIAIAGGNTDRLRPHVKTHKMAEVIALQVERGITKFKAATLAEAEMVARAGGDDVLVAHQLVGPKVARLCRLAAQHREVRFSTIVDCPSTIERLSLEASANGLELPLYLDIDCGMQRTGIALDHAAGQTCNKLIGQMESSDAVRFAGLHVYDGHLHQPSIDQRRSEVGKIKHGVCEFIRGLIHPQANCDVVVGGSPTFAIWAEETNWALSPGTPIFWDVGYANAYAELDFKIAAALLTRVISKPAADLLCFDLGHKAISSEMPLQQRVTFPELGDAELVSHSEEHLVVRTSQATKQHVGDAFLAFPQHICPTVADHSAAHVVRCGRATGESWPVTARER